MVNPAWRELDKAVSAALRGVRKLQAKLGEKQGSDDAKEIQANAELLQDIQSAELGLGELRNRRSATPRKVTVDSLPEDQRPTSLLPLNKQLGDAVKMIAYRSETALVGILRQYMNKEDDARALVRELLVSSADIEPNISEKTITVRIHRMASPEHDRVVANLLEKLTAQNFCHPETGQRIVYVLV